MTKSPEGTVKLHIQERTARLEIDNPKRLNAMTHQMWMQVPVLVKQAIDQKNVRVLLLKGANDTFCAGADISELITAAKDAWLIKDNQDCLRQAALAIEQCPLPTLALLQGACFGGGVALAVACDFRIATTESRFAVPPARLGIPYSLGETRNLYRVVGATVCRELLLAAKELNAAQALSAGLVQQVVPAEKLDAEAETWVNRLCQLSPFSQQAIKQTLNVIEKASDETPESLYQRLLSSFQGADFKEGSQAFIDKRKAVFKR